VLPAGYQRALSVSSGRITLAELMDTLVTATGTSVRIASAAGHRRLLTYVNGARAREVVQALEDLYGWRLTHTRDDHYSLGRTKVGLARNGLDLAQKLPAVLPPAIELLWS